nr:nucleoside hydrolase [Treponema socranskii]
MAEKIILDVDTGSDDAIAIMTAVLSCNIDLRAVCTTWGNLCVDLTTDNTLRVLEKLHSSAPVYKGCSTAMVKYLAGNRISAPPPNITINGKELRMHEEHLSLPKAKRKEENEHAVSFYVDFFGNTREPVTWVATGPLTNLGVALSVMPDIKKGIKRIVIMGGGHKQANVTLCAEANVWHDPEAAQIVLNSGIDILWVPLDATHTACLTTKDCEKLRSLNNFAGNFAAELIESRITIHNLMQPLDIPNAAAVHDALAVCAVINSDVLKDVRKVHMKIGLSDLAEGRTIIDCRLNPDKPNCEFAFSADRFLFSDMLYNIFKRCEL